MALKDEFQLVASSKPAELLRRAITAKLELLHQRLVRETDQSQFQRLQGRALELTELLDLLKP